MLVSRVPSFTPSEDVKNKCSRICSWCFSTVQVYFLLVIMYFVRGRKNLFQLFNWFQLQLTLIVSNSVDSNFWLSRIFIEVPIYNLTPVESRFRMSRIKVLVPRCRKPYYLHSLSQIYLSNHVYYLGIKIRSQVKHPVIDFDIFTLVYFTCLFHNLSN